MSKTQKVVLLGQFGITIISIGLWIFYGAQIWTKNQVLIEKKDELFGWTKQEWVDQFVLGLDLTLAIILSTSLISSIIFFYLKKKNLNK